MRIDASVGVNGINLVNDVRIVQTLLNMQARGGLSVDGLCGPKTIQAIKVYQSRWMLLADGRIDRHGPTWKLLARSGQRQGYVLLPDGISRGYYRYSPESKQYGTAPTIKAIQEVALAVRNVLGENIGIGDISLSGGGPMSPHASHQRGKNVDVRPLRVDGQQVPVSVGELSYSREHTKILIEAFLAHGNVRTILFNDARIAGVTPYPGHHNHLHVAMKA